MDTDTRKQKDTLIVELWLTIRDLSDQQDDGVLSDEDMNLWMALTAHRAIQDKLSG